MTIFDAVILGIIEGITEFLPISSTGHLILSGAVLNIDSDAFYKTFEIAIQLGAILSVCVLYFKSFFDMELIKRLIIAFIPTGIAGFLLYPFIKTYLLGSASVVLASLFVGGVILIIFELFQKKTDDEEMPVTDISLRQAFTIGVCQIFGMVPGVSRSGATIVGGLALGLPRTTVVEFSFLLAVPTMVAATGYDLLKNASLFTSSTNLGLLLVGFSVSFIVALFSIVFLLRFVREHTFIPFGIYRIIIASLLIAVIIF